MLQGAQILADEAVNVWTKQGHHLTGGWENSLKYSIIATGRDTTITGTMNYYGVFVNAGVGADRIPYGGPKTGATTSKYIQGLISFWKLRGLSDKAAISAAFATAKKQKKEGMPTAGSYQYSESGQRTQFIAAAEKESGPKVDEAILNGIDAIFDEKFNETKSETI